MLTTLPIINCDRRLLERRRLFKTSCFDVDVNVVSFVCVFSFFFFFLFCTYLFMLTLRLCCIHAEDGLSQASVTAAHQRAQLVEDEHDQRESHKL